MRTPMFIVVILFTWAVLLISAGGGVAAEQISFSAAVDQLYRVNETIAASDETINRRQMEKYAARGLYFPTLSVNAGYIRFDKDIDVEIDLSSLKAGLGSVPGLGGLSQMFPSSVSQTLQKEQLLTINGSAMWPIFTGGKIIAANKAASLRVDGAEAEKSAVKSKLVSELASLYFGVRLANNIVSVREEVYITMKDHYSKAVKLEKAGMLAKVERMHAEVALSEAERGYSQSKREAELSRTALKSIINLADDVEPSTPLFIVPAEVFQPLSYFQAHADGANAGLRQLDVGKKLTDVAVKSEYSTFMPSIFLFATGDIYSYDKAEMLPDFTFGVGLTYNLFEGFSGYNKIRAAKAAKKSLEYTSIRAKKDIKTLIEQQYMTIQNARADYEAVQASLAFTEEYLRARTKAFAQGMATSLDVVDAELALSGAKMEAILAAYKFDIAMVKLLETSGLAEYFEDYRSKASAELGL